MRIVTTNNLSGLPSLNNQVTETGQVNQSMHCSDADQYKIKSEVVQGKDSRRGESQNDDADQLCERNPGQYGRSCRLQDATNDVRVGT